MRPGQKRFLFAVGAMVTIYSAALLLTVRASQDGGAERYALQVENGK